MRTLCNFLVLCALSAICGWVAIGWLPDRLDVIANPIAPVEVRLVQGEELLGSFSLPMTGRSQRVCQYLPSEVDWRDLRLEMSASNDTSCVTSITLQRFSFLSHSWTISPDDHWKAVALAELPAPVISSRWSYGEIVLALFIALMLFAAWLITRWKMASVVDWRCVCTVSVVASMFFCIVVPMQSYLSNVDLFDFTLVELLAQLVIHFTVACAVMVIILGVAMRCFGRIALAIVLAVTVCGYLETGILSIGLPELNGNEAFFLDFRRAMWDFAALALAFGLVVIFAMRSAAFIKVLSVAMAVMAVVSLFDVQKGPDYKTKPTFETGGYASRAEIANCVQFSTSRNVLVFVLDSITSEDAMDALKEDMSLTRHFAGFTAYTNNVGMHAFTLPGVAGLCTGQYQQSAKNSSAYYESIFNHESILSDYLSSDFNVYFMPGSYAYGYANRSVGHCGMMGAADHCRTPLFRRVKDLQAWNLFEVDLFRLVPFGFKRLCNTLIVRRWPWSSGVSSEAIMYSTLADRVAEKTVGATFLFVHTDGTHIPIFYGRHGERLSVQDNSSTGSRNLTIYLLGRLGTLLDALRRSGFYDNSLIVVTADHGDHYVTYPPTDCRQLPSRARPFLWVKPMHSTEPLKISSVPTSHKNIALLLRKAAEGEVLANNDVRRILYGKKRMYRDFLDGCITDWIVDENNQVDYRAGSCEFGVGDMAILERGKLHSVRTTHNMILFVNKDKKWMGNYIRPEDDEAEFWLKTTGQKDVTVTLVANLIPMIGGAYDDVKIAFGQIGGEWVNCKCQPDVTVSAHCKVDESGIVKMRMKKDHFPVRIHIKSVEID